jgi:hypothetical protein
MFRATIVCIVLIALLVAGGALRPGTTNETQDLQDQRIELLKKRLELFRAHDLKDTDLLSVEDPNRDLLLAKLEYAASNGQRQKLYSALIDLYDQMISDTKLEINDTSTITKSSAASLAKLYYLQSERIRIEILSKKKW